MRFITPKFHGIIDYVLVIFLLTSPTIFGFNGLLSTFTYVLGGIHLLLTLLTDFKGGLIKIIPLPIHGFIELLVSIILIVLSYTLFKKNEAGDLFYKVLGAAILMIYLFTDYEHRISRS